MHGLPYFRLQCQEWTAIFQPENFLCCCDRKLSRHIDTNNSQRSEHSSTPFSYIWSERHSEIVKKMQTVRLHRAISAKYATAWQCHIKSTTSLHTTRYKLNAKDDNKIIFIFCALHTLTTSVFSRTIYVHVVSLLYWPLSSWLVSTIHW